MNQSDTFFSQQNMNLLCRDDSCSVYQMKNETGDGTATYYEVYPGIGVMYNDFHMASCPPRHFDSTRNIGIHHCREGRIEWEVSKVGYTNTSKFSEAFKKVKGKTPLEYRKIKI